MFFFSFSFSCAILATQTHCRLIPCFDVFENHRGVGIFLGKKRSRLLLALAEHIPAEVHVLIISAVEFNLKSLKVKELMKENRTLLWKESDLSIYQRKQLSQVRKQQQVRNKYG